MPQAWLPPRAVPGGRRGGARAGSLREEVGTHRGGGRDNLPRLPGAAGTCTCWFSMRRGEWGRNKPYGGSKAVPREHRGGLIGEDLWVWEEKAEAGLGRGKDKRKRGRAARRGRTPPGSAAAAVPSRVLPVVVAGPPFPSSRFLPVASPATEG